MDNTILNGTIISVVTKETRNGDEFKHISVMKENSQEILELNAFNGKVDLDQLKEGKSFEFKLVKNGDYINLEEVNELPDGTQLQLTPDQVKVATDVSYKNKSISKKTYVQKSYFTNLTRVECETAKKGKFTYVSWAEAWAKLKSKYPLSTSRVYENVEGLPYFKVLNNLFVKVGVTVEGIEHICWYPVLDNYNKAIPIDKVDAFMLNKSLQRAFAKAIAMHGLGLYVFKGEDVPNDDDIEEVE